MKKLIHGLHNSTARPSIVPEGFYLVKVRQAMQRESNAKPYLALELEVLEPESRAGQSIRTRLYCTPKALWKLHWFLQDFGYDRQLFQAEELDDKLLPELCGAVKVSHHDANGQIVVHLDGFAPALNCRSQFQLEVASKNEEAA